MTYLGETHRYGRFLLYAGRVFAAVETALVFLNIATPILFSVDAQCVYRAHPFRYVLLSTQILLLLLNAAHAFDSIARGKRTASKNRYLAIAFFGIIMAAFLTIQLWYPYLPVYSVVNSLCELDEVNEVRILIDGSSDVVYRESLSLDKNFQFDHSYVSN